MQSLRRILWNHAEGRLRAGWRLFIQFTSNVGLAVVSLALVNRWASPDFDASPVSGLVGATLFLGVTLLTVWLAGRFLDRRAFSDFGLHLGQGGWWADLGMGLAVGFIVPAGFMLLASAAGWVTLELVPTSGIPWISLLGAMLVSAVTYACIGLFEELGRAYHIRNLLEGTYSGPLRPLGSMVVAVVGAALISVAMHRGDAAYLFYVFVAASVLGLFYLLTGRMAIAAGVHMAYDFTLLALFGIGAEAGGAAATLFRVQHDPLTRPAGDGLGLTPAGLMLVLGVEVVYLLLLRGWVRLHHGRPRLKEGLEAPTLLKRGEV